MHDVAVHSVGLRGGGAYRGNPYLRAQECHLGGFYTNKPTNDSRVDIMPTRQGSVRQNVKGKSREQELTGKEVARKIKRKSG